MADNRPCKAELLDWINTVSFVCDDTKLFLDTHPCNTEALEFYEEFKNQRMQALQEYAKYYTVSCENHKNKPKNRTDYTYAIWWT